MWYGDPRDARRAARYARRNARRAAHYARRDARRAFRYGYGYGRPGGMISLLFFGFLLLAIFTHFWGFFIIGIIGLGVMLWLIRAGILSAWFPGSQSQQPRQPQQPYFQPPPEEQPYSPYDQGYHPPARTHETYRESGQQLQYAPQAEEPEYKQYEEPQAQYPEQLPPMPQQ
jgi:hypothetical protein